MSQTAITYAFEQWKARQAVDNTAVVLDEFIFANVPGLDITGQIDRAETLPPAAQIVHRAAVNNTGLVNENAVVYSVVLDASTGDFDFNWIGLVNRDSGTLAMIVHAPLQKKIATAAGQQGNVLTRSFLMEYTGAAKETGINTPAETWQIDFTARLAGADERIRTENIDVYGAAAFFGDGWLVQKDAGQYVVNRGAGYVAGLRASLTDNLIIEADLLPALVWLDVSWQGAFTGIWRTESKITLADALSDYSRDGFQHYVFAIARIEANGSVTDLRPKGSVDNQQAESRFLRKDACLSDVPDKAQARDNLGIGITIGDVYPVGAPIPWPLDIPPENHALMVGQQFDTKKYPVTAKAYPEGVLPDMRKMTVKGKPDGRDVLSYEADGNKRHGHSATVEETDLGEVNTSSFDYGTKTTAKGGDHTHTQIVTSNNTGQRLENSGGTASFYVGSQQTGAAGAFALQIALGAHGHKVTLGPHGHNVVIQESGNDRTTVENIAFNYIVRLA